MKDLAAIREFVRKLSSETLVRRFTSYLTSLNSETAEGTASHFRGATICLLASTLTVATVVDKKVPVVLLMYSRTTLTLMLCEPICDAIYATVRSNRTVLRSYTRATVQRT